MVAELETEDTLEHQLEVLEPTHTEFKTIDGKTYYLPNDFTLRDIYRNKVVNSVTAFMLAVTFQLSEMGVTTDDFEQDRQKYIRALQVVLPRISVQDAMNEMLQVVLRKPKATFEGALDSKNISEVFAWTMRMLSKLTDSASNADAGEPQTKKGRSKR